MERLFVQRKAIPRPPPQPSSGRPPIISKAAGVTGPSRRRPQSAALTRRPTNVLSKNVPRPPPRPPPGRPPATRSAGLTGPTRRRPQSAALARRSANKMTIAQRAKKALEKKKLFEKQERRQRLAATAFFVHQNDGKLVFVRNLEGQQSRHNGRCGTIVNKFKEYVVVRFHDAHIPRVMHITPGKLQLAQLPPPSSRPPTHIVRRSRSARRHEMILGSPPPTAPPPRAPQLPPQLPPHPRTLSERNTHSAAAGAPTPPHGRSRWGMTEDQLDRVVSTLKNGT